MASETEVKPIAVDTNVFLHLLNRQEDPDSHIDHLLIHLAREGYVLCVDSLGKISAEYQEKIEPALKDASDMGIARILLSHWMKGERIQVTIDLQGALISAVKEVIPERNETVDRLFVAVSCTQPCALVTNDDTHILSRKRELRRKTRKWHKGELEIMNSREAREHFVSAG